MRSLDVARSVAQTVPDRDTDDGCHQARAGSHLDSALVTYRLLRTCLVRPPEPLPRSIATHRVSHAAFLAISAHIVRRIELPEAVINEHWVAQEGTRRTIAIDHEGVGCVIPSKTAA